MRALLVIAVLALSLAGCRRNVAIVRPPPDTLVAGTFINSAGTWTQNDSNGSRELTVSRSGNTILSTAARRQKLTPAGSSSGSSGSTSMTLESPADPWFIFVESPSRLWFFDGRDELTYSLSDHGGSRIGPAIFSGQLHPTAEVIPTDLIPRLPAELQKLFPPVVPREKLPSF